jgi:hypothetical protein
MKSILLFSLLFLSACNTTPAEKSNAPRERKTTVFSHFKDSIDRAKDISKTSKKHDDAEKDQAGEE